MIHGPSIPSRGDAKLAPASALAALTAAAALALALALALSATAAVLASASARGSWATRTALLADVVRVPVSGMALAAAVAVSPTGILVAAALRIFAVVTGPAVALSLLLAVAAAHRAATLDALGRRVHVMAFSVLAMLPVLAALALFASIRHVLVAGNSGALAGVGRLRARGGFLGRSALGLVVVGEGGRKKQGGQS
jgi:hypothetical protein